MDRMADLVDLGVTVRVTDLTQRRRHGRADRPDHRRDRTDRRLVNNAGYGSYGSLEDVTMAEARRQVEVNLFALARLTQLVLPHMRSAAQRHRRERLLDGRPIRRAAGAAGTTRPSSRSRG